MIADAKLCLKQMKFTGRPGWYSQEQTIGSVLTVDVCIYYETDLSKNMDELNDVYNYEEIYSCVKSAIEIGDKLIEETARKIAVGLKDMFVGIAKTEITLTKLNPPVGNTQGSSITYVF